MTHGLCGLCELCELCDHPHASLFLLKEVCFTRIEVACSLSSPSLNHLSYDAQLAHCPLSPLLPPSNYPRPLLPSPPGSSHFCSNTLLIISHCAVIFSFVFGPTTIQVHGSSGLECSSRWLGSVHSWTAPTSRGMAQGGAQRVSRPTEGTSCRTCAACSARSMAPDPEDQPRQSAREGPVHSDQAREGVGGDGRRVRSSSRGPEVRVDQSQSSLEATSVGCRDRSVSEVYLQSREAHQGVGCPTRGGECSAH